MHQMPLVLFTVLIQASTGLLLFIGLSRLHPTGTRAVATIKGLDAPQIFMWGLFILGLTASLFHLGKPVNAFNVLRGVSKGSPLSIEMVCVGVFGVLTFLYTLMSWKGSKTQNALLAAAMLAGLVLSYAVANVYIIVTIPLWDSIWTFIQFFMSVAVLGAVGILFMSSRASGPNFGESWKKWNTGAMAVLLCLTVSTTLYAAWSGHMLGQAGAEVPMASLPVIRVILQVAGLFLLIMAGRREGGNASGLYAAVFLCIFGSELAGRIFFYSLQQVSGMLQIFAY
jgi:DMSO reductase anchor subunit